MKLGQGWRWVKCGEKLVKGDIIPIFPTDYKVRESIGVECQITRTYATQRKPAKRVDARGGV